MDVGKPEVFEPARGSGTEISMLIEAVDDHWPGTIEIDDSSCIERLERLRPGPGQVLLHEDRVREDIQELDTTRRHPPRSWGIDTFHHARPIPEGARVKRCLMIIDPARPSDREPTVVSDA